MNKLLKTLKFIKRNVHYLIVLSIILGLLNVFFFGGWNISKGVLISITMFLVIFPVMINLKVEELFRHIKKPRSLFYSLLINFTVSPLIAFLFGKIFFADYPNLFIALMILSFIPTSAMTAAWTSLAGGRLSTAMMLIPMNLFFSAFIAIPFVLPFVLGNTILVSSWTFIKSVLLVFLMPLILGIAIRKLLVKSFGDQIYKERIKPELSGVSSLGIIILTFFVLSLKRTALLFSDFTLVWVIALPLVIYYISMMFFSIVYMNFLVSRKLLDRKDAIVVGYASSVRHLNITLAVILIAFPFEQVSLMVLFVILGFIVQIPLLGFYTQHYAKRFVKGDLTIK